tara:strand:- start:171 stop:509 length:339 start_codon:yes stop_codon:yes gene_type:complete
MVKRHDRGPDGKYLIKGEKYDELEGSRPKVMHKTAYQTPGGLIKEDLMYNKEKRIVSVKKHKFEKKEKRLLKHGYTAKKGKFGAVKVRGPKKTQKKRGRNQKGGMDCNCSSG